MRIHENALVKLLEDTMARMLQASAAPMPAAASLDHAQTIRSEMRESIKEMKVELTQLVSTMMETMEAEADRRADAMLQAVIQMLKNAPETDNNRAAPVVETDATSEHRKRTAANRGQQQPMQAAQPSWAAVTGTGTQKTSSWTTVTNGKKKVKRHPLD